MISRVPTALLQMGITRLMAGELQGAADQLHRSYLAHTRQIRPEPSYVPADAAAKLALLHAIAGEPALADHWLTRFEATAVAEAWYGPMIESSAHLARMLVDLDRLELGRIRVAARTLSSLTAESASYQSIPVHEPWLDAHLVVLAWHALICGDPLPIIRRIGQVRVARRGERNSEPTEMPIDGMMLAAHAELLLASGQGDRAGALLRGSAHPAACVPRARLALLSGNAEQAVQEVATARTLPVTVRDHRSLQLIAAVAHHRLGDHRTAEHTLRAVAHEIAISGSVAALATVPREEIRSIARHVPEVVRQLNSAALSQIPDIFPSSITVVRLTPREQEILGHLAGGLPGPQIAAQLYVSDNTLKFHRRNLYRKLGVESRQEALARAQEWDLLPVKPKITIALSRAPNDRPQGT